MSNEERKVVQKQSNIPQLGALEIVDSDEDINQQRTIEADDTVEDFIMKFNPPKNSVAKSPNRSPKNSNPQLVIMEPSQVEIKQTEDPPSEQSKPVTKRKSRIMFDASADEGENTKTEDEEKAHKLLRTRRQSRGLLELGADATLGVPGAGGGAAEDRMRKISEKIAQKVKVENLVRNLKMTELEKFAKNKSHSVFLQKVTEDTKREMNVSIYYQLLRETLEILKSTNTDYERNLGRSHSITKDIQDRIYYIEDVLETQELNQESPVSNNIFSKVANDVTRGISRIGRVSRTQLGTDFGPGR